MEIKAKLKYLRSAPRKVRLVADMVRGKNVEDAINVLNFSPRKVALPIAKLIHSAVANAEENGGIDVDILYVKKIHVDEGPTMKRFMPRAMGRATRINKRTSHVTLVLDEQ